MARGAPPGWVSAWGQDRYGVWAAFAIGNVQQRMRWIPPGTFTMGSPRDEPGRHDDEGPQQEVVLTRGFWMADTPCTQALWTAVIGSNPSHFVSPDRPVERVSAIEVEGFLIRLSDTIGGDPFRLPTEVEWEYACRAGTTAATYAGPIEITGERNAPVLDDIAWYVGNSGVIFELADGVDSSGSDAEQYADRSGGTHPVGRKLPNAWGLYDMLGNVLEWCADGQRADFTDSATDLLQPAQADSRRAVRGGSWILDAQSARAARRGWAYPGFTEFHLGFRLVLGQAASRHTRPEAADRQNGGAGAGRGGR